MERFETLEFLRDKLFLETLYRFYRFKKVIAKGADAYSREYETAQTLFSQMYSLLEETGFEGQYQAWKQKVFAAVNVLPEGIRAIEEVDWSELYSATVDAEEEKEEE